MRDLFVVREEKKPRDARLEFFSKQISQLQNKITHLAEIQKKQEKQILKQQEIIQKYVEEQKQLIDQIQKPQLFDEENNTDEDYILIDEKPNIVVKEEIKPEIKSTLEIEAVQTVSKNKKTIIKQKILAIASKQRTTATKVKEIIVDKYKYCSKATFYRYLSELKKQHKIETISINDKEYVCNVSVSNRESVF